MDLMALFGGDSAIGKMMAQPIAEMERVMALIAEHMSRGNQINDQLLAAMERLEHKTALNNALLAELLEEKTRGEFRRQN